MNAANKIIMNTIILFVKIIVCTFISLWSVPIVLNQLGKSDFGLYNLVAGVIVMLSFLNAAMTVSTQRFISVTRGTESALQLNRVYNVSILFHILIGFIVVLILGAIYPFWDKFLNIPQDRINAAQYIYAMLIISTFFTIISVPFDAVMNAYENMLSFSLIAILESILKLMVALSLAFISFDRLRFYGTCIALIAILIAFVKICFTIFRYRNLKIHLLQYMDWPTAKSISSFAIWNTLGATAMVGRNQGIAVVLNHFFGTVINATYGIANQVNGLLGYFSSTLQKSINPQLMMSEGMKEEKRLLHLSYLSSKYSVLLVGFFALPLMAEMPFILKQWLKDMPGYTIEFTRMVIMVSIVYQFSTGIMSLIQSKGRIASYTLIITVVVLSNIPLSYFCLRSGMKPYVVFVIMICLETISLFIRMLFARKMTKFDVTYFLRKIMLPILVFFIAVEFLLCMPSFLMNASYWRLLCVCLIDVFVFPLYSFYFLFNAEEKFFLRTLFCNMRNKIIKNRINVSSR